MLRTEKGRHELMGFGILFLGYFIATVAGILFPGIAGLLGFALSAYGLQKLSEYQRSFRVPMLLSALAAVLCVLLIPNDVSVFIQLGLPAWYTASALTYANGILQAIKLFFHVTLGFALRDLAKDTGEEKLSFRAVRNAVFYIIYYLLELLVLIPALSEGTKYLKPVLLLFYLFLLFLFHIMLFSAYMRICDEQDAGMEIKKTNIGWFDRLNSERAAREQKAADETTAYFQKRFDRMNEKNKRANAAFASNGKKKGKRKKK